MLASAFHITVNYASELFSANQVSKTILTLVLIGVAAVIVTKDKESIVDNHSFATEQY